MHQPLAKALDSAIDEAIATRRLVPEPDPTSLLDAAQALTAAVRAGGHLFIAGPADMHSDVAHMTVEFVHPVLASARDIAATPLTGPSSGACSAELRRLARPGDVCTVFARSTGDPGLQPLIKDARAQGLTTIGLVAGPVKAIVATDHVIDVGGTAKEWFVAAYHVLWEAVQVMLAREPVRA